MRPLLQLLARNAPRASGVQAAAGEIIVDGPIVPDDFEAEWFGGVSLAGFRRALAGQPGDVKIRVNSPGGDVFAARAMAQAIREHGGRVDVQVDGCAASAATLLVVAASRATMSAGSLLMIHRAWTITMGDTADHTAAAELLAKVDGQIAESYAAKAKGEASSFAGMMAAETWFTPEEAVAVGLVDEALPDGPKAAKAWDLSAYAAAPYQAAAAAPSADDWRAIRDLVAELRATKAEVGPALEAARIRRAAEASIGPIEDGGAPAFVIVSREDEVNSERERRIRLAALV